MKRADFYKILKKDHDDFRRSPEWLTFRKYILASRNCTCEFCGKKYTRTNCLDVHHIYKTNYKNLTENRFLLLCKTCHTFLHKKSGTPFLGMYTNKSD